MIEAQGIKIYTPPIEEDDEHAATHARSLMAAMPFAVIGSEKDVKANDGRVVKGRQYAWGVAEVENEDHCDFKKLRSILIRTHMLDLIHTTEESHYEAYRAQQMETRKFGEARPRKLDNPKFKAQFGCTAKMLAADEAEPLIGHGVGGVCPFALNEGVDVFLDESLRRFDTVYPAAGNAASAVRLTPDELERCAAPCTWVDVCKVV